MLIIVAVIGAALIGWLHVSKGTGVQQAAADERAALLNQADAPHADTVKRSLSLFGVALAWAMRREMMAGDLVKLDGVEEVAVTKENGMIVVASDRCHAVAPSAACMPNAIRTRIRGWSVPTRARRRNWSWERISARWENRICR